MMWTYHAHACQQPGRCDGPFRLPALVGELSQRLLLCAVDVLLDSAKALFEPLMVVTQWELFRYGRATEPMSGPSPGALEPQAASQALAHSSGPPPRNAGAQRVSVYGLLSLFPSLPLNKSGKRRLEFAVTAGRSRHVPGAELSASWQRLENSGLHTEVPVDLASPL